MQCLTQVNESIGDNKIKVTSKQENFTHIPDQKTRLCLLVRRIQKLLRYNIHFLIDKQ